MDTGLTCLLLPPEEREQRMERRESIGRVLPGASSPAHLPPACQEAELPVGSSVLGPGLLPSVVPNGACSEQTPREESSPVSVARLSSGAQYLSSVTLSRLT